MRLLAIHCIHVSSVKRHKELQENRHVLVFAYKKTGMFLYLHTRKQACSCICIQENTTKAHVLLYFLYLVLSFIYYFIMDKGAIVLAGPLCFV